MKMKMPIKNGIEIYWENMKEINNSRDLGTDGKIFN
jgi:hypothetical protein